VSITNLLEYKQKKINEKLNKRLLEDVDNILLILEKSQQALIYFKKYKPVQELISIMETNKTLLTISKQKHEKNSTQDQDKK